MLGILCCRLCQCNDRIETGIELNLYLAQGILTQFIEVDQRALGRDEITNDDNRQDNNNNQCSTHNFNEFGFFGYKGTKINENKQLKKEKNDRQIKLFAILCFF
jgi:hypothetical protein